MARAPRWESVQWFLGNEREQGGSPQEKGVYWDSGHCRSRRGWVLRYAQSRLRNTDCVLNIVGQLKAGDSGLICVSKTPPWILC